MVLSLPAIRSLTLPGGYTSHDLTHHVIRQISMDQLLSEGQFPPRWSSDLNNGYGYPVFLFNYPLPAIIGEIFHKLGFGFVDSVKAVLLIGLIGSGPGMYLFLKAWLKDNWAAFLGSIFYVYAPIRFINTYVSASVGSSLALVFVPLVFWSLVEVKNGKRWAPLAGALSLAALITSHNVTALIFAPLMVVFALSLIRGIRVIRGIGVMFLLGLGLSAWFFIPAVFEAQFIRYGEVVGKVYLDQFPSLSQIFYSPWGFGLSHPQTEGGMSYQVGLIHWLAVFMTLGLIYFYRKHRQFITVASFFLSFFFISLFLMLKISLPVWENSVLGLVQYPFRLLAVSVFSASILAGLLVKYLPFRGMALAALLVLVLYANRNHLGINQPFSPGGQYYINQKTTTTTHGEHLPKWGSTPVKEASGKLQFVDGNGRIEYKKDTSILVIAEIETSQSAKLRFNQFYFPGWEFELNSRKAVFDYLKEGEHYGLPLFSVPAGKSVFLARFQDTPDRKVADSISLLSVAIALILLVKRII